MFNIDHIAGVIADIMCRIIIFTIRDDDDGSHLCSYHFASSLANVGYL
jgi:hypothetical protein